LIKNLQQKQSLESNSAAAAEAEKILFAQISQSALPGSVFSLILKAPAVTGTTSTDWSRDGKTLPGLDLAALVPATENGNAQAGGKNIPGTAYTPNGATKLSQMLQAGEKFLSASRANGSPALQTLASASGW